MKLQRFNGSNLCIVVLQINYIHGFIGGGMRSFHFHTRDFTLMTLIQKRFYRAYVTGSDFKGSIEIYADGVLSETFVVDITVNELNRKFILPHQLLRTDFQSGLLIV